MQGVYSYSIKTRIKTQLPVKVTSIPTKYIRIPLKQGLRLILIKRISTLFARYIRIPLKQGLRQFINSNHIKTV